MIQTDSLPGELRDLARNLISPSSAATTRTQDREATQRH